ncbi:MAG: 1-aminocyclopropane-1-carboxylate deaminase/D-cysteine desulfhydrase [Fusicatenibacter sp.]|nr:pyridoxal-phosphate dependent enzyme [Fusicatenibacter sp.]
MSTPVYELHSDTGNRMFVKRDDLLSFGLGGNKVRIANAFFDDMKEKNCDTMIAYGSTSSNLCRVIANRCAIEQIPCYIICSHSESEASDTVTSNTRLMELLGASMIPCKKNAIAQAVEDTRNRLLGAGRKPYYIYGNKYGTGNEGVAARAYADAYQEIIEAEHTLGITFDYLFHASGTGATQSGLICGHLLHGDAKKIVGISVSRDRKRGSSIIAQGVTSLLAEKGFPREFSLSEEILLEDEYRRGGYGLYDEAILACIQREFRTNSLPLDPVYTGKAFLGMEEYLKKHQIKEKNILFLHTGGTPLFYDCLNRGELTAFGKENLC